MACLSEDQLLQYLEGNVSPHQRRGIDAHCDLCETCRTALTRYLRASRDPSWQSGTPDAAVLGDQPSPLSDPLGARLSGSVTHSASSAHAGLPALDMGEQVGRYVVLRPLGAGGAGVVYLAYDPELDRYIALKLMRTDTRTRDQLERGRTRLLREARAAARLSHPNVVAVYHLGTHGENVFIAMELVSGQALSDWLRNERRTWRAVLAVFIAAGRGLAAAHEAGIIHRDFKPSNVLIDDHGQVRITDFGLAQLMAGDAEPASDTHTTDSVADSSADNVADATISATDAPALTRTQGPVGTPAYMSPEQFLGRTTDARSDQFSFCVSLYQALCGQRPFSGDTVEELAAAVIAGHVPAAPLDRKVPMWLHRAVVRGLSADPAERFPSMHALLDALERKAAAKRNRRLGAAALIIGAAGLGALGFGVAGRVPEDAALCSGAARKLAGIWDEGVRDQLRTAFAAVDVPFSDDAWVAVETRLDTYVGDWVQMHAQACQATHVHGEQSERDLDLRMHCLDRRLAEVSAFVGHYANADADMVTNAVEASHALSSLALCGNVEALASRVPPPADAETQGKVDAVRAQLAAAKVRGDAGNYAAGTALASTAVATAETIGYRPLLAEARYWFGHLNAYAGEHVVAETALTDAAWLAEASGHDRIVANAWIALLHVVTLQDVDHERGQRWARRASAAVERLGNDPQRRQILENNLGLLAYRQFRFAEAETHWQTALHWAEKAPEQRPLQVAKIYNNIGLVKRDQQELESAEIALKRAAHLVESALGPRHPELAPEMMNLGTVALLMGNFADAVAHGQRALAITELTLGAEHPRVAIINRFLGTGFLYWDRYDQALVHFRRAQHIQEQRYGSDHPALTNTLIGIGVVRREQGAVDEALMLHRRAVAMAETAWGAGHARTMRAKTVLADTYRAMGAFRKALDLAEPNNQGLIRVYGAETPDQAYAELMLGRIYRGLDNLETAIQHFERALTLFRTVSRDRTRLAQVQFALAQSLWQVGRERARARQLAVEAHDTLTAAGPYLSADAIEVAAWLQATAGAEVTEHSGQATLGAGAHQRDQR